MRLLRDSQKEPVTRLVTTMKVEVEHTAEEFIKLALALNYKVDPNLLVQTSILSANLRQALGRCFDFLPVIEALKSHVGNAKPGKLAFADNSEWSENYHNSHIGNEFVFHEYKDGQAKIVALRLELTIYFGTYDDFRDDWVDRTQKVYLDIPIELVYNFDKKKFDAWIDSRLEIRLRNEAEADVESLRKLLKKHKKAKWLKEVIAEATKTSNKKGSH